MSGIAADPCNRLNMQRMQRPEQGASKRCQLVLEELTAEPVHDPDAECVKGELEQVERDRIKAGHPADEPISRRYAAAGKNLPAHRARRTKTTAPEKSASTGADS